jgi:syntaxin 6
MEEQDESLNRIGTSLRSLKNMSHQIGDELEDQSEMLDHLGTSMSGVEARMNDTMKKLAKLTRLEDGIWGE